MLRREPAINGEPKTRDQSPSFAYHGEDGLPATMPGKKRSNGASVLTRAICPRNSRRVVNVRRKVCSHSVVLPR